ncbi:hypothetical protein PQX77_020695 [Marasmius sp. AFHP31]|nr:hypothetical protein PQX77_020695 [Marasmius sp. AFHP31]
MSHYRFPLGEYTPPGLRSQNAIAFEIDSVEYYLWAYNVLIFCNEGTLDEIKDKEERERDAGVEGDVQVQIDREWRKMHLCEEVESLKGKIVLLNKQLAALRQELADNNQERSKIYHHFPAQKI